MKPDWTNFLPADMVMLILRSLDPLTIRLYGMTSKANRDRRNLIVDWRCRGQKAVYSICTLLDTYGTVQVLEWADSYWTRNDGASADTSRALENRNFESAAWLIEKKGYRRRGFRGFMLDRDYEGMDWCYDHGFIMDESYLHIAKDIDIRLLDWFAGKRIHKEPPVQYRHYDMMNLV